MQDPIEHSLKSRNAGGYRSVPSGVLGRPDTCVFACVAGAISFGLVVGLGVAVMASHARAISPVARALKSSAASLYPASTVYAATNPALLNAAGTLMPASSSKPSPTERKADSPSQVLTLASDTQVKSSAAPEKKKHHLHKLWHWKKSSKSNVARRKPYVSPSAPAAEPDQLTGLQRAQAAAASGPFFLGIEGDVTVASYDVADGRVETYEGSNFKLSNAGSIHWQSFPFDVHYRCDGGGNCTLMRGGASAIAKLTR